MAIRQQLNSSRQRRAKTEPVETPSDQLARDLEGLQRLQDMQTKLINEIRRQVADLKNAAKP